MHQGRRFDVGNRIDERAQRAHAVRRLLDLGRQRLRRHIADVAIAIELHPGPAVALVVDADRLTEQGLRLEADRRRRVECAGVPMRASPAPDNPARSAVHSPCHRGFRQPDRAGRRCGADRAAPAAGGGISVVGASSVSLIGTAPWRELRTQRAPFAALRRAARERSPPAASRTDRNARTAAPAWRTASGKVPP